MKPQKQQLMQSILTAARYWGHRIATAESCTGGMLAAALTKIPGASDMFDCGFVTYSNAAKTRMLGVAPALIAEFGAVSPQVAVAMAEGALARSDATLAISITGIAGPGDAEFKPEGRVCFALARSEQASISQTVEFGALGRTQVRRRSRDHALAILNESLTQSA